MNTATGVDASVVIPTYNRRASLLRTLAGLQRQTHPAERFEVVVVDDGSIEDLHDLDWGHYAFAARYVRQANAGAAAARNTGAQQSRGAFLLFLDDDIVLAPEALQHMIAALHTMQRLIVLGNLIPVSPEATTSFAELYCAGRVFPQEANPGAPGGWVPYIECKTGLLGIRRLDFLALGGFRDPTGGWPNWDDVDFGYRAHRQGFHFWRSAGSVAYHHDKNLASLELSCSRITHAYRAAARLARCCPEIIEDLPALRDKTPIVWGADSPALVIRKALRTLMATSLFMNMLRRFTRSLEPHPRTAPLLALLYRWQLSICIQHGYRAGLREEGERPLGNPQPKTSP